MIERRKGEGKKGIVGAESRREGGNRRDGEIVEKVRAEEKKNEKEGAGEGKGGVEKKERKEKEGAEENEEKERAGTEEMRRREQEQRK
jgi:hypothetical protein